MEIVGPDIITNPIYRWVKLNKQKIIDKNHIEVDAHLIDNLLENIYKETGLRGKLKHGDLIYEQEGSRKTKTRSREKKDVGDEHGQ